MLDDAHDILGATLYDLNFDVTLIPGENSRQFGLVKLELCEPDLDDTFWKRLYDGWVQSARDEINDTSIFVQSRALAGSLTEEDAVFTIWAANEAQIKQEAAREKAQSGQATDLASAQEQTYANVERFLLGQSESLPDGDRPELARLIAEAVRRYYEEPMHGLLILGNPERLPSRHSSGIFFKIPVDAVLCGSTTLKDRMTTVKSSDLLAAITTEPKEYAQNISDVAAARLMSDFLAAFSGSFAGKASVAGDLEHMRDTEIFLQAIRRQPLAVGFGDGRTTFGWVLGPKYAIEESWQGNPKPVFKHTPIRHATSASIIAPAWWPSVKIKVTEQWIDEDGESISRKSAEAGSRTSDMNVSLPTDLSMITQTLMHGADREGGRPRLRAFWQEGDDEEKYQLEANTAGELLIRGKHLWRNPQVFVGSQRADSVRILADLNALHATFARVLPIAGAGDRDAVVDLTVVTSYGASTLRDAVVVHPSTSQIVTARLVSRVVSGTDPVRFEFDPPPPTAFANLQLQIRQADSLDSWEESNVEVMRAEGRAAIPIELKQTSALLEFQLRIKMQPNGDWINVVVSEMQSLVYVKDEAELKLKLEPTELTFDADGKASDELRLVVKMNPPQLFDEVYPWLKASDSLGLSFGGKHSLAVQRDAHGLFVDKDKLARSGSWLAPTQDQKKTQEKKHSSLLLRSPNGETVEVDGTLTVKQEPKT